MVAPLVGAWIEIEWGIAFQGSEGVAPLVGAWIEIIEEAEAYFSTVSLLSWERGLKCLSAQS